MIISTMIINTRSTYHTNCLLYNFLAIGYVAKGISKCFKSCNKGEQEYTRAPSNSGTCSQQPRQCALRSKDERKLDKAYRDMEDYEWRG